MKNLFIFEDLYFIQCKLLERSKLVKADSADKALEIFKEFDPTPEIFGVWKATPTEISEHISNGYLK